jgi:tryptophanyl-tRNA synthetase
MEETKITPWEVTTSTGIDYLKLIKEFGCQPIDAALVRRFEKVTRTKAHPWLRRGIFFSHKDLNIALDAYEKGEEVYLYTGRGPSSESLHLGHMVPFMFTKYLQDAFDAIVVIQMTDDEKYYFKDALTLDEANRLTHQNAKDIIACGFNPEKTWIFSNLETVGGSLYRIDHETDLW